MVSIDRHAQIARRHRVGFAMPSISNAEPGIFAGIVGALGFLFRLQAPHDFGDKP
ncbi:hypothetical protein SUDANB21_02167 [Streptomyces sp. enrichment culture]